MLFLFLEIKYITLDSNNYSVSSLNIDADIILPTGDNGLVCFDKRKKVLSYYECSKEQIMYFIY